MVTSILETNRLILRPFLSKETGEVLYEKR